MGEGLLDPLLEWYGAVARPLPWRETNDPYAVWVSEIMLQQTQVAAVVPYYLRWMERFPTLAHLAAADEQDVLSLWQGLGYYRRCKNLLAGARLVVANGLPSDSKGWMQIPGVGRYTASAISSIAQGETVPLVDGNVERVFARLTGFGEPKPQLTRAAWKWAENHVSRTEPGDHNQALMELGAVLCTPRKPKCDSCPVKGSCYALAHGTQSRLPVAAEKPKPISQRYIVWVPYLEGKFGLQQIPEGEWWAGMWQFPKTLDDPRATSHLNAKVGEAELRRLGTHKHAVTHHRITIEFYLAAPVRRSGSLTWRTEQELRELPLPAPQRRIFEAAREGLLQSTLL